MDHSHMDHSHMGHGGMDHGGGGMDHGTGQCNMNMLFTWSTKDLCIVFPQWHIRGTGSLIWSLLVIVALTAGYEGIREISRRYEESTKTGKVVLDDEPITVPTNAESSSLLNPGSSTRASTGNTRRQQQKIIKASLYAVQVFYSFFIMLLFMTYNGWVMLAVAVGAFVGYLLFGSTSATKTVACH